LIDANKGADTNETQTPTRRCRQQGVDANEALSPTGRESDHAWNTSTQFYHFGELRGCTDLNIRFLVLFIFRFITCYQIFTLIAVSLIKVIITITKACVIAKVVVSIFPLPCE